jgi:dephospho-CoA kinase
MKERGQGDQQEIDARCIDAERALNDYASYFAYYDHVIINSGTLANLSEQVRAMLAAYSFNPGSIE